MPLLCTKNVADGKTDERRAGTFPPAGSPVGAWPTVAVLRESHSARFRVVISILAQAALAGNPNLGFVGFRAARRRQPRRCLLNPYSRYDRTCIATPTGRMARSLFFILLPPGPEDRTPNPEAFGLPGAG
jgi:hypothetical protein